MKIVIYCLAIALPLCFGFPQRSDWYQTYFQSEASPLDPVYVPGVAAQSTARDREWHQTYPREDSSHLDYKEPGLLGKVKSGLYGIGKNVVQGFTKVTGIKVVGKNDDQVYKRQVGSFSEHVPQVTQYIPSAEGGNDLPASGVFKLVPLSGSVVPDNVVYHLHHLSDSRYNIVPVHGYYQEGGDVLTPGLEKQSASNQGVLASILNGFQVLFGTGGFQSQAASAYQTEFELNEDVLLPSVPTNQQ